MTGFASPAFLPFLLSASRDSNSPVSLWLNSMCKLHQKYQFTYIFLVKEGGHKPGCVCIYNSKSAIHVRLLLWQTWWDRQLTDLNTSAHLPRLETQPQVTPWAPQTKDRSFCSLTPLSCMLASSELSSEPWLCSIKLWGTWSLQCCPQSLHSHWWQRGGINQPWSQ